MAGISPCCACKQARSVSRAILGSSRIGWRSIHYADRTPKPYFGASRVSATCPAVGGLPAEEGNNLARPRSPRARATPTGTCRRKPTRTRPQSGGAIRFPKRSRSAPRFSASSSLLWGDIRFSAAVIRESDSAWRSSSCTSPGHRGRECHLPLGARLRAPLVSRCRAIRFCYSSPAFYTPPNVRLPECGSILRHHLHP